LTGKVIRLEPLQLKHAEDLYVAGQASIIWRYLPAKPNGSLEETRQWIETALQDQASNTMLPFAIVSQDTGRAVGSTRYHEVNLKHRGVEIGWTWLNPAVQRTAVNTECKYLLLRYAFETLGAIRVQLKTDSRNLQSQRAIERLGAVKEGILRNHMIMPDGYYRHSVFYSILDTEWPGVKAALEAKLQR
jgi:RimJ/RimL family protein N-acetyltransferase